MHFQIAGETARHRLGRGVEAQRLLDGARNAGRVACDRGALLGVLGEQVCGVADELRGRLVARDDEEEAEPQQLRVGERLALLLGRDQHTQEVVAGLIPAFGDEAVEVAVEGRRSREAGRGDLVGVGFAVEERVGRVAQRVLLDIGNAEHLADHGHRQQCREVADEVDLAGAREGRDQRARARPDRFLESRHARRRERATDQRAQLRVAGWIHLDDVRFDALAERLDGDALRRREGAPVVGGRAHVVVARQCPEVAPRVEVRGCFVAQAPVDRVRIFVDLVRVRVELERGLHAHAVGVSSEMLTGPSWWLRRPLLCTDTSCPTASARNAPTVHRSRGRTENGS